jgi:arylsulfatase A-like enzyme/pimeloyl-ACP methyl ester carboxylesterase
MYPELVLRLLALPLTVGLVCVPSSAQASKPVDLSADVSRPNIVFFLVDDLGWQDISVPMWVDPKTGVETRTAFNDHFRTPTLEGLADCGVRFSQAYSCSVCSPTRTSILSGQNAARHKVTQWTLQPGKDQSGKTERLQSPAEWRVDGWQPEQRSLARILSESGYFTIHAGKAHWGARGTAGADPRNLGFDVNIAGHHAGAPSSYLGTKGFGAFREGQQVWTVPGLEAWHGKEAHLTDVTTELALQAVDSAIEEDKPFFLYLAHYAVHTPLEPHDPLAQAYRDAGIDEKEARYASMVEGVDQSLAEVLAHLEERGVAENTIILFTSDNGGLTVHARGRSPLDTSQNTHNLPLRAGKGSAYEGGTRVPMIVGWAKQDGTHPAQQRLRVTPGIVRHEPVIIEDSFATVLRWAGAEAPEPQTVDEEIDGRDWTELLGPQPDQAISFQGLYSQRPLLFHYPHVWGPNSPGWGYEPHSAMRLGDWKVIYFYQPQRWELYNLANDLGEQHDLSTSHADQLNKMARRMVAELQERGAQWPTHRASGQAEPPVWVHFESAQPPASALQNGLADPSATPLVLIHGWSEDSYSMSRQLAHFGKTRRVLAIDLPGHGRSIAPSGFDGNAAHTMAAYADQVAKAMDRAGFAQAILIGHSNGVVVAREFARRHPQRLAGMVTLDGALQSIFDQPTIDQICDLLYGEQRAQFLASMQANSQANTTEAELERIHSGHITTRAGVQVASFRAAADLSIWKDEVSLAVPLLAVHAEQQTWNDTYQAAVRALGEDVDLVIWKDVGHHIQWERTDELHALIEAWLEARGL